MLVCLTGAQLVVLAVAALVAWRQVREARRLREQQIRPFVVIDFEVEQHVFYLTVANVGTALARDVTFDIDPAFTTSVTTQVAELKMLTDGVSSLAPGKRIRTFFDAATQRRPQQFPDRYRVCIRYRDQDRERSFNDEVDLDLGIYRNLGYVDRKGLHDLHERVKDVVDVMRGWGSSGGGLLAMSPVQAREEANRRIKELEDHARLRDEST